MKQRKTAPNMFLFSPNRKTGICAVLGAYEHTVDYNFGTFSEMSFKIPKKIYDFENRRLIENPCYSKFQKNLLIYTNDDRNIFHFKGDSLYSKYGLGGAVINRFESDKSFIYHQTKNWDVRGETELFDIGIDSGYSWNSGSYIDSKTGGFMDMSDNLESHYQQIACQEFIPVSNGDIVGYTRKARKIDDDNFIASKDGKLCFGYEILYYSEADASTFLKSTGNLLGDPIGRHCIDFPEGYTSGYIRFSLASYESTYTPPYSYVIWRPRKGFIKIYSGEMYCNEVENETIGEDIYLPLKWWVITDIQESSDRINATKTITLRSYEYTLSNKTFSLQEGTLPLYLPPSIPSLVNSDNWIFDRFDDINYYHKQHMKTGILNQILEKIPNWSIGYISSKLIKPMKYRTFDKMDNANIYSFLINEVQSKFNCFVIFDVQNKKINLVHKDDVCNIPSSGSLGHNAAILTWENAIKEFNISTNDTQVITAMRIHTSDDTYGIGLVNPTGNSIIYNFDSMSDYMNYIADKNKNRNLSEAVNTTLNLIDSKVEEYRGYARDLIKLNMQIIKLTTKLSEKLTDYNVIADQINIALQADYAFTTDNIPDGYLLSDTPRTPDSMKTGIYKPVNNWDNYSNGTLYSKILDAAETYYSVKSQLQSIQKEYDSAYNSMKEIAKQVSLTGQGDMSKTEITELDNFIVEGDWSNPNAVFKDTYSSDDIYNTLIDVYNDAKEDFDNIYSKPTYEFDITSANILALPDMEKNIENMYLGNNLLISSPNGFINPVLLSIHINYDDLTDFSMSFSTDYKRKPYQLRFSDLFGTINQTSVDTPTFTFDT